MRVGIWGLLAVLAVGGEALGAGFVNLDFKGSGLPTTGSGYDGFATTLPGWTVTYTGATAPGSGWNMMGPIEGYSVVLHTGLVVENMHVPLDFVLPAVEMRNGDVYGVDGEGMPVIVGGGTVGIQQTGGVPFWARSLRFDALGYPAMDVLVNGVELPVYGGVGYEKWVDVSAYAGSTVTLTLRPDAGVHYGYLLLADLGFSAVVPEVGTLGLLGVGGVVLLRRRGRRES